MAPEIYGLFRLVPFAPTNFAPELTFVACVLSSAIAGLCFWKTPPEELTCKLIGINTALAAVLTPPEARHEGNGHAETLAGYRVLDHDLYEPKELIAQIATLQKNLRLSN
jgi:hypothetical protein